MDAKTAKLIIRTAIIDWDVKSLVRIVGTRGDTSIEIKEKKAASTTEQTKLDNFISDIESKGFKYQGIGVGYDYNTQEYTMIFSWK